MAEALLRHADGHFKIVHAGVPDLVINRADVGGGRFVDTYSILPAKDVGGELAWQIEVKHCLEDLRSALDYCAFEVYERACCRQPVSALPHVHTDVRFPIPMQDQSPREYGERVDRDIPRLAKESPTAIAAFVSFLKHATGNQVWLTTLDANWNIVKHRHLVVAQEKPLNVFVGGGGPENQLPPLPIRYFSITPPRPLLPNLVAGLAGAQQIVYELRAALPTPRSPPKGPE
jgi:hypothetical protein